MCPCAFTFIILIPGSALLAKSSLFGPARSAIMSIAVKTMTLLLTPWCVQVMTRAFYMLTISSVIGVTTLREEL